MKFDEVKERQILWDTDSEVKNKVWIIIQKGQNAVKVIFYD